MASASIHATAPASERPAASKPVAKKAVAKKTVAKKAVAKKATPGSAPAKAAPKAPPEPWQGTVEASLRLIDELDDEITAC